MKLNLLTSGLFCALAFSGFSQDYRIANWYKDFPSATVLTYDDWSPGHPTHAVTEHLRTELPATWYVTTGNAWRGNDFSNMNTVTQVGAEVGNHTVTHAFLPGVDAAQLENEINGAQTILDNGVTNQQTLTFCYPQGGVNGTVLAKTKENHIAARGIYAPPGNRFEYDFANNENDYFELPTIAVNYSLSLPQFEGWIDNGIQNGGLVTFMFHSISGEGVDDGWWDEIDISYYRALINALKAKEDETWITTVREAVIYHKEANSATMSTLAEDADSIALELTDTLSNNSIYNHPLSIYLNIPDGHTYLSVKQDGIEIDFEIQGDTIVFDAVPDGGDIVITKLNTSSVATQNIEQLNVFPNPAYNAIQIQGDEIIWNTSTRGTILNVSGQIVQTFSNSSLDIEHLSSGVYWINVQENDRVYRGKFIKK
jgi:chitin deacetylase